MPVPSKRRRCAAIAAATLHLSANARGAVYTNFVDGRPRRSASPPPLQPVKLIASTEF